MWKITKLHHYLCIYHFKMYIPHYKFQKNIWNCIQMSKTKPEKHIQVCMSVIYIILISFYWIFFLAKVSALDEAVGKIVSSLKLNGLYKNSIILFSADVSTIPFFSQNWKMFTNIISNLFFVRMEDKCLVVEIIFHYVETR